MKKLTFAALSLAVLLYAGNVFAQHEHSGSGRAMGQGMGSDMDHSMAHGSMGSSNSSGTHGNPNTNGTGQPTVNDILQKNPAIGDKITTLTGAATASDACTGFRNLGQCVAAAHVAKNLDGGNFYCLRQAMTGTAVPTGTTCPATTGTMSLGKAIQSLYPQADASAELKKGNAEAKQDLKSSGLKSLSLSCLKGARNTTRVPSFIVFSLPECS
jgi:hypothetical protein